MDFAKEAESVAIEAKEAIQQHGQPPLLIDGDSENNAFERLQRIALVSPRAAILEAFLEMEAAALKVINNKTEIVLDPKRTTHRDVLKGLQTAGALTSIQVDLFRRLGALRNEAVHLHEAEFTTQAVDDYIESAHSLALYLLWVATENDDSIG